MIVCDIHCTSTIEYYFWDNEITEILLADIHRAIHSKYNVAFTPLPYIRPPLSKKWFPVSRVGTKTASREVGDFFPP